MRKIIFEKDENMSDNSCTNFRFIDFIVENFLKQCRIRTLISTTQLVELLGEILKKRNVAYV